MVSASSMDNKQRQDVKQFCIREIARSLKPVNGVAILTYENRTEPKIYRFENLMELETMCLQILHECYYHRDIKPRIPCKPTAPKTPLSIIKKLPTGDLKRIGLNQWIQYQQQCTEYDEAVDLVDNTRIALQQRDGALAYACLKCILNIEFNYLSGSPWFLSLMTAEQVSIPKGDLLKTKPKKSKHR